MPGKPRVIKKKRTTAGGRELARAIRTLGPGAPRLFLERLAEPRTRRKPRKRRVG